MKKILYKVFKPKVFKRFLQLEAKKEARIERLKKVIKELKEWDDIPINWQFIGLCEILKIKPNEAAKKFIFGLTIGIIDIQKEAKKLPLI